MVALSKSEVLNLMPQLLLMPGTNLRALYKKLATAQIMSGKTGECAEGQWGR